MEPMAKRKPVVAGVGLVTLDVVTHRNYYVEPQFCAGGTCGNVLAILSYLGWSAYPIARLNGHVTAKRVKDDLKRWGVNLDFIGAGPTCDTPVVIQRIATDSAGRPVHRYSLTCPHCGKWLPGYRPIKIPAAEQISNELKKAEVFFLDRISPGNLLLAKKSAERGALVFFEPSGLGEPRLFNQALAVAHVVKYSADRITALPNRLRPLLEIKTLGASGLRYRAVLPRFNTGGWQNVKAFQVPQFMDAGGSGDWTSAGIIDRLGRRGSAGLRAASGTMVKAAFQRAQAMAAWNCSFFGARGGMYHMSETQVQKAVAQILSNRPATLPQISTNSKRKLADYACPACRTGRNVTAG